MPIRIADLQNDVRTCEVEWDGETAAVTYRPSAYTPEVEDQLQTSIETRRPSGAFADLLAGVLVEWEVVDDAGQEIEPSRENLRRMGSSFLAHVVNTLTQDMQAEREDRKNSADGLPKGASKERARRGTRSSGRRSTLG